MDFLKNLSCSPIQVGSGGSCSTRFGFTVPRVYFLLCLHFDRISSLLFSVEFGSAIKIVNFSVRHKSHCFPPLDMAYAFAFIDHVIFGSN